MKCPKCRHDNPENTRFCGECGAPLAVDLGSLSPTRTILGPVLHLKKGQTIAGKYKIAEKIGEGGMGIVYKAEDMRLDRTVALKFLPPELMRDEGAKARFIQEAKAAAALDHPHICTVYEVDEADGQSFISMAFIEGQSLKDRLESGPLEIEEAKSIAAQVAEGLYEAHEKGIIHRDIKPANIMLTGKGQAKIMDFGLAKLSWGADLTKPSMIMGTVAYMSPEQARGEPVDHRTDIWSLGAMLYEMLTGELPFGGENDNSLVYSVVHSSPRRLRKTNPGIPAETERAVLRALEKNPADRYQTIKDFLSGLGISPPGREAAKPRAGLFRGRILGIRKPAFYAAITALAAAAAWVVLSLLPPGKAAPKPQKSIIVLPFKNISPEAEQDYFCDGMTEEIIAALSRVRELLVISRSSAMTFKETEKTIPEIAGSVNVRYVLEGSVRKAGNDLRITAQLIEAETDAHLWAENYTGTLDDVFTIQENVARSIADSLKVQLGSAEKWMTSGRPIADIRAYEFYLKARREIYSFSEEGLERALRYLENGLEIADENPLLLSSMGNAYFQYWNMGIRKDEAYLAKAKELADRIFKTEPDSPYGRLILGLIRCFVDPQEAIRQFRGVLADDPHNEEALLWLCICYTHLCKGDEAKPFLERLVKTDPLNPIVRILPGLQFYYRGELDRALESLGNAYRSDTEDLLALWQYGRVLASCGRKDEALSAFETVAREGRSGFAKFGRLFELALRGEKQGALQAADTDLGRWARRDFMASWWLAECLALVGESEKAMGWLENAVDLGFINYPFLSRHDPFLVSIRGDPRFKKLMERVKREWENFAV